MNRETFFKAHALINEIGKLEDLYAKINNQNLCIKIIEGVNVIQTIGIKSEHDYTNEAGLFIKTILDHISIDISKLEDKLTAL